jgi:hypothetical protein
MQSSPKALRYMPGASRIVISTQKNKKQKKKPCFALVGRWRWEESGKANS